MRKVLDILRLAHEGGRSQREIAGSLALSQSTVHAAPANASVWKPDASAAKPAPEQPQMEKRPQ